MKHTIWKKRFLVDFASDELPITHTSVLVVGSGVAGLSAALEASKVTDVLIITKDTLTESNTQYAQGGIAVVLDTLNDSIDYHIEDTVKTGNGISNEEVVGAIISEAPNAIKNLISRGAQFDKSNDELELTREGGHSHSRIIHAKGDATGAEVERTLIQAIQSTPNISRRPFTFAIDLITKGKQAFAMLVWNQKTGFEIIRFQKCILATGGIGQTFRETTNPAVATGDGIAIAFRAGATVTDMEFVQFHPTTLYIAGASRALISETVRGEGALLKDKFGTRFMPSYHPDAELAPRDVVSRAIAKQMQKTNDTNVYLDLSPIPKKKILERFPMIYETCKYFDLDISKDLIPVRPSAHYFLGGVKIDVDGRTDIANLFACGECASCGFHGANRLGSNSLLEGLVVGARAGHSAAAEIKQSGVVELPYDMAVESEAFIETKINIQDVVHSLQSLMWRNVGIERDEYHLKEALNSIDFWSGYILNKKFTDAEGWIVQNMLTISRLIVRSALKREESRGVHFRSDFPETNDTTWKKHIDINRMVGYKKYF